jgi:hypothetical protein
MEFESSNKLKGYLSNESKRLGIHSNKTYTMYFIRRFLEKLYANDENNFAIKGSVAQLANTGTFTRPITDIDAVSPLPLEESYNMIEKIVKVDYDPIKYNILEKFTTDNNTICMKILCNFDRIEHLIHFDLKQEESKKIKKTLLPIILQKDNKLSINHSPIEKGICDKIYIILKQAEQNAKSGKKVRRFKDFYDLYNMITLTNFDINLVKKHFYERWQTEGPIDLNAAEIDFDSERFVIENHPSFTEDKIKFAFLKDIDFNDLANTSSIVINNIIDKTK